MWYTDKWLCLCSVAISTYSCYRRIRISEVVIITRLWNGRSGVRIPGWEIFFNFLKRANRLWDPSSFLFNEYLGFFNGTKRSGCNTEHSYPFSLEVRNDWNCTPTLATRFHGLEKYGFTFPCVIRDWNEWKTDSWILARSLFEAAYSVLASIDRKNKENLVVVKALHYKPTGRGFDSRSCHWNFSVT